MHTHQDNLLHGFSVDEEVTKNNGNDKLVLPLLRDIFRHLFLTLAGEPKRRVLGAAIKLHQKIGV